jgi:hypothetical protein
VAAVNQYHFEDHWHIPYSIEKVWDVLADPERFPVWWEGVYLSTAKISADRIDAVARGWLPYKLRFQIETIRRERPTLIEFKARGDFRTDSSKWILAPEETGTHVILDWNPIVEKPVVRFFSPILKPLFEWNHRWTMRRGESQITEYIRRGETRK